MKQIVVLLFALLCTSSSQAQWGYLSNYFDGADTTTYSLRIQLDTTLPNNIWQIGAPQKTLFNQSNTFPNALVTDTLQTYPINNLSYFYPVPFDSVQYPMWTMGAVAAVRWTQKLDMDADFDGGWMEFSADSGQTWQNAFNNPYVYSFYGYDAANLDTLATGEFAFSGTDSLWKDIWLCFDRFWADTVNLRLRFVFKSDSIDNLKDGWIIDNMIIGPTFVHTANKLSDGNETKIFPNPAKDRVTVELTRSASPQIIETMELYNLSGQLIERWQQLPAKFYFPVQQLPAGLYFVKIKGSQEAGFSSYPLIINR